jgi:hypothetical protein
MVDLWPVQRAVFDELDATPSTYPVYDAVPQGVAKPYIVIGEISATPDDELAAASADASCQIHAWSAKAGKSEVHAMLEFIRSRLDNVRIEGMWACSEDFAEIMEDRTSTAASRLYHAVARYRLRVG